MKMKLSDWADIAEIIGGVAIVASLIFVGVQIEENSRAVRSGTFQAITESDMTVIATLMNDPELSRLYATFTDSPGSLTEVEIFRVVFFYIMAFRQFENVYEQFISGVLPEARWLSTRGAVVAIIASPGGYCFFTATRNGREMASALKQDVIDPLLATSSYRELADFCPEIDL